MLAVATMTLQDTGAVRHTDCGILFYLVDRLPKFIAGAMDAAGNGQYLSTEIKRFAVTECKFGCMGVDLCVGRRGRSR